MHLTWKIKSAFVCVEIHAIVRHSYIGEKQGTQWETKKIIGEKEKSCNVWIAVVTLVWEVKWESRPV